MEGNSGKWKLLKRSDHNYFIPYVIIVTTLVALWLLFFSHASVLNWIRASVSKKPGSGNDPAEQGDRRDGCRD